MFTETSGHYAQLLSSPQQWRRRIQNFWQKSGGGWQRISPVVIHRKCTRWTTRVLYGRRRLAEKTAKANGV